MNFSPRFSNHLFPAVYKILLLNGSDTVKYPEYNIVSNVWHVAGASILATGQKLWLEGICEWDTFP